MATTTPRNTINIKGVHGWETVSAPSVKDPVWRNEDGKPLLYGDLATGTQREEIDSMLKNSVIELLSAMLQANSEGNGIEARRLERSISLLMGEVTGLVGILSRTPR